LRKSRIRELSVREIGDLEHEIIARLDGLECRNVENLRAVRREFSRRLADVTPDQVIAMAQKLVRLADNFPHFFAYELVQHHPEAFRSLNAKSLQYLSQE
jgi:hypothetical protein